jgi:hypothetical protein
LIDQTATNLENAMNPYRCLATSVALSLALGLVAPAARSADIVVNFNDLGYPNGGFDPLIGAAPGTGSYDDGWDLKGGFTSSGTFFSNSYSGQFGFSGWAYSNVNDPTTTAAGPGNSDDFLHQFAAITGTPPPGSSNYAIEFGTGGAINLPAGTSPVSFEVTNTTYSYLAMTLGDSRGMVTFDLADYTSASSLPVDAWTLVNLSSLTGAQSLTFDYTSTDTGEFGINTPEYFAMDDLTLSTSVPEPSSAVLALTGLGIMGLTIAHRRRRAAR